MKKLILPVILLVNLSGCLYQSISSTDIENAEKICVKSNSTIDTVESHAVGTVQVRCKNMKVARVDVYRP